MQVALSQRFPFVPIEPDTLAALAVIQGKAQAAPDEVLNHAKTTLGTVYVDTGFRQGQFVSLSRGLRNIPVLFQPLPILGPANPMPPAFRAGQRRKMHFQI